MNYRDLTNHTQDCGNDSLDWCERYCSVIASYEKTYSYGYAFDSDDLPDVITVHYTLDRIIPKDIASVPGFDALGVVRLEESTSSQSDETPGVVHHFYYAYGDTLKSVLSDYEQYAGMSWRMAQMIVPKFPHHSVGNRIGVLDPVDDHPFDSVAEGSYAEVIGEGDASFPIRVELYPPQAGRKLRPRCVLFYDVHGKLGGFKSSARRGDKEWHLKTSVYKGQWYVAEVFTTNGSSGFYRNRQVQYIGDYERFMSILRDRGIIRDNASPRLSRRIQGNGSQPKMSHYMWSEDNAISRVKWIDGVGSTRRPTVDPRFEVADRKLTEKELSAITVDCEVNHDTFGKGIITSMDETYVMVRFSDKERRFQWPEAFERGYLSLP